MQRQSIPVEAFNLNICKAWSTDWFLLTAGDFESGEYNAMTVAWGSIGIMWSVPFVQVVVRPTRYTYGFMEQYPTFTLSLLPDVYRRELNFMGTRSGRDTDKVAETGLTPVASGKVAAPAFDEAELIIECEKIYFDDMRPNFFLADYIAPKYEGDYHRIYYGEIAAIWGTKKYQG